MVFPGVLSEKVDGGHEFFQVFHPVGFRLVRLIHIEKPRRFQNIFRKSDGVRFPRGVDKTKPQISESGNFLFGAGVEPVDVFDIFHDVEKMRAVCARALDKFCTVASPIPRRGTLIILAALSLSNGFIAMRR